MAIYMRNNRLQEAASYFSSYKLHVKYCSKIVLFLLTEVSHGERKETPACYQGRYIAVPPKRISLKWLQFLISDLIIRAVYNNKFVYLQIARAAQEHHSSVLFQNR